MIQSQVSNTARQTLTDIIIAAKAAKTSPLSKSPQAQA